MTLAQEISDFQAGFVSQLPAEALATFAAKTEQLVRSGIAEAAIGAGDEIPGFSLPGATGRTVSGAVLLASGPLVISFYRGSWCPYCNLELHALQQIAPEITALGARLVAISPNLPDTSLTSVEKHALTFEVLSDVGNTVARQFGLVFTLDEELRPLYRDFGIDLPGENGDDSYELPIPATYVVRPDGIVAAAYVNADYTRRMEPADILAALRGLNG